MNMYPIIAAVANLDPMNKENVLKSLEIMWKGVLAIFVTIAIILFVSWAINTICNKVRVAAEKKKGENDKNASNKTE